MAFSAIKRASADASSFGLGAVLCQRENGKEPRPVAYVSRAMTPTELRYAQIEKGGGPSSHLGMREIFSFHIETDHKPLVPLFSYKLLDEHSLRIQRFRMRICGTVTINHVPGSHWSEQTLSHGQSCSEDYLLQEESDAYIQIALQSQPASLERLKETGSRQNVQRSNAGQDGRRRHRCLEISNSSTPWPPNY